jgi:hypothetical protein
VTRGGTGKPHALPRAPRRSGPIPVVALLAVFFVLAFLLSGLPQSAWVPTGHGATSAPEPRAAVTAHLAPRAGPRAAPVRGGPQYASLCLLRVLRACSAGAAMPESPALPLGPGTPSSWTNITPPSGAANPSARALTTMAYYPTGHEVILFGGALNAPPYYQNDTWAFAYGAWTELISNSSCTATTCPSGRADAMIAYDAPMQALVLFGGEISFFGYAIAYNDTWLFQGGHWKNITSTAGPAPSARFAGAMTWDALDDQVVLFGGSDAYGNVLGDTWAFDGTWHNITATVYTRSGLVSPSARAAMSISDSPSGYLLMFGGEAQGTVLWDYPPACYPLPVVAWWFYQDRWSPMRYSSPCVLLPRGGSANAPDPVTNPPPCGREYAALGWSPKNQRFVLYGGYGPVYSGGSCGGTPTYLNDTWTYGNTPGNAFYWQNVSDPGDPSYRYGVGFAADLTDNYFLVFGGVGPGQPFNSTYRYFALVHADLTGPSRIDTNASHVSFQVPFTVQGYGGSGTLDYQFDLAGLVTPNTLTDSGTTSCGNLTNPSTVFGPLPFDGLNDIPCLPSNQSYNVYRLTLHVFDVGNTSDAATANWTFRVDPPETMLVDSQFAGYFYTGLTFPNKFTIVAKAAAGDASVVTASLAGVPVTLVQRSGAGQFWDGTVNMGDVPAGPQTLQATATFAGGWVLNTSYTVNEIATPSWLTSILLDPQVTQTISPHGTGPYNENYSITEAFSWSLDKALGFNIELPFVKGNVSLIPSLQVSLTATSTGNVTLTGSLGLTPPAIDLGPASIQITVTATLSGTFALSTQAGAIMGVTWVSATASITIAGKFSASVPIYGFNILGLKVGFTLEVEVDPSVTLGVMLAPTTPGFDEFIPGIAVKVSQFFATLSIQLQIAVNFGIGIASIGIGGAISVAVGFAVTQVTSSVIYLTGGWLNGSIFVEASFLWWSDQWNLASGTIYSWTNPPPSLPLSAALRPASGTLAPYNNGTNTSWTVSSRSYVGSGFDQNVWSPAESVGQAISDIYPHTAISVAASADGSYLFFTDDNQSHPATSGLTVSGLRLDGTSNVLSGLPSPPDPGFVLANPRSTTLPDGNLFVLWDAVPAAESSASAPSALTTVALHGAEFHPGNRTWGAVRSYTSWGFAQSFAVDPTGSVVALVSPTWLPGASSSERLLELDLTTGAVRANFSVTGISAIVGVRSALGLALVQDTEGNYSTASLASGDLSPLGYTSTLGGSVVSADLLAGSSSTAVLLDRGSNRSLLVLYDLAARNVVASLPLGESVNEARGIASGSTAYVFVRDAHGIRGWSEAGGSFTNVTSIPQAGVVGYALGQDGSGVLVAYLVAANRSSAGSSLSLDLAVVGATLPLLPSPPGEVGPGSGGSTASSASAPYPLYLAAAAGAAGLVLAVVAITTRRKPPTGPSAVSSTVPRPETSASPPPLGSPPG